MPTLIELATPPGVAVPTGVEGTSLVPLMMGRRGAAVEGGKRAVLTQFPRCVQPGAPMWQGNDCDDVDRHAFTHMGLSVRTDRWRLTIWYSWDGAHLRPRWDEKTAGVELYDHAGDDGLSMD